MTQSSQRSGPQSDAFNRAARWEERYASVEQLWSGRPNDWLPELAADWVPGAALEIGCGEGADVLWLAERGWQVTGLDLSATAVGRLSREAARRGLTARVSGRVHDAGDGLPEGSFDLVTSFYVHGGSEGGLARPRGASVRRRCPRRPRWAPAHGCACGQPALAHAPRPDLHGR